MADLIVQLGDGVTDPQMTIKITQNADGTFHFDITQQGPVIGDIRGLFFDIANEALVSAPGVQASIANVAATGTGVVGLATLVADGNDTVTTVGGGDNTMQGALAFNDSAPGYDIGIEFGTQGIGKDDVRTVSFDLSLQGLTLADLQGVDFGMRLTSVGVDGARTDSSKLTSMSFQPVGDGDENINCVLETTTANGDLVADTTTNNGTVTVTQTITKFTIAGVDYNPGDTVTLPNTEGATVKINADGTFTVVSGGDELGADEHFAFDVTYAVHQVYTDGNGHVVGQLDETSTFKFDICGENDNPVANNDAPACITENGTAAGNVLTNDTDIDRTDTLTVFKINGEVLGDDGTATITLANGATLTINADGTFTFNTNHAYDSLNDGEHAKETFTYQVSDGHNGFAEATLEICIDGEGSPLPALGLSHGYWKTHASDWGIGSSTSFEAMFGVDRTWTPPKGASKADLTFMEALNFGGGGQNELAREAVAAYLNIIDEKNGVDYDFQYTLAELKDMVKDAFDNSYGMSMQQVVDLLKASHEA